MAVLSVPLTAQERKPNLLQRAVKSATGLLDRWAAEGIDTNYVALPRRGGVVSVSAVAARMKADVHSPLMTGQGRADMNLHSELNGQGSVYVGYRAIGIDYSYDFINGYSKDFSMELQDNKFGISYRRHTTKGMHGTLRSDAQDKRFRIHADDTEVKATMLYGYYLPNGDRFSLSAATDQSYIQLRSAGSPIVMALYHFTQLKNYEPTLVSSLHGMREVQMSQAALGAGYAYNHSIRQGRVVLHAMVVPMVIFHNNNWITLDYKMGDTTLPISQKMQPKHRYSFTEWVQAGASWNINSRNYLSVLGCFNQIDHQVKNYGIKIGINDWLVTTSLGYRF